MRVTRRVRPSQVGCGATVARRRLYAAIASAAEVRSSLSPAPRIALIIEPDGEIVSRVDEEQIVNARLYDSTPDLVASNASGR